MRSSTAADVLARAVGVTASLMPDFRHHLKSRGSASFASRKSRASRISPTVEGLENRLLFYVNIVATNNPIPFAPQVLSGQTQSLTAYTDAGITPITNATWSLYSATTGATIAPLTGSTTTYTAGASAVPGFDFLQASSSDGATTIPVTLSPTNQLWVTMTSLDRLWIDANKPLTNQPWGAWLAYKIENPLLPSGDTAAEFTNLSVNFSSFSNQKYRGTTYTTPSPLFERPLDFLRTIPSLKDGQSVTFYFYVDYWEAVNQRQANTSSPPVALANSDALTGFSADYSLSVSATNLSAISFKGSVRTETLITANAAGQTISNTLDVATPYLGQSLHQTVEYSFGNNQGVWFMPASEKNFQDDVYRLIEVRVIGPDANGDLSLDSANVTDVRTGTRPLLSQLQDRLWFSYVDIAASNSRIVVEYTWDVLKTGTSQTVTPWAGGQSGTQFKYQIADATQARIIPPAGNGATISKTVELLTDADGNYKYSSGDTVLYTVTITNTTAEGVDLYTHHIYDQLPAWVTMANSTYDDTPLSTNSKVTAANSTAVPAAGASGLVHWYGIDLDVSTSTSYLVPGTGTRTLTLKYTATINNLIPSGVYTNSVKADFGNTPIGPATASFCVSYLVLVLDDPSTTSTPYDVIVVDGMPVGTATTWGASTHLDANSTVGEIFYSGAVGNYSMTRTTAQSAPGVGTAASPELRLSTVVRSSAAGTLNVWVTDGCFRLPVAGTYNLYSPFGGVAANAVTLVRETIDLENVQFADGNDANTLTNSMVGPFGPGGYSGTISQNFGVTTNPFSLTKQVTFVSTAALQQSGITMGGKVTLVEAFAPELPPPPPPPPPPAPVDESAKNRGQEKKLLKTVFSSTLLLSSSATDSVLTGTGGRKGSILV